MVWFARVTPDLFGSRADVALAGVRGSQLPVACESQLLNSSEFCGGWNWTCFVRFHHGNGRYHNSSFAHFREPVERLSA